MCPPVTGAVTYKSRATLSPSSPSPMMLAKRLRNGVVLKEIVRDWRYMRRWRRTQRLIEGPSRVLRCYCSWKILLRPRLGLLSMKSLISLKSHRRRGPLFNTKLCISSESKLANPLPSAGRRFIAAYHTTHSIYIHILALSRQRILHNSYSQYPQLNFKQQTPCSPQPVRPST
jgi:hypothetical protein